MISHPQLSQGCTARFLGKVAPKLQSTVSEKVIYFPMILCQNIC
uniref:Uncharacterized protein n=1 Tax=Anguilla anguilla TaxID=7936 RepID=A0A0E9W832_ANGAN